jgi:hypothetical protein
MAYNHAGKVVRRLALLVALLTPQVGSALTGSSLRDLADPVTPGGLLAYRVTLQDLTAPVPAPPTCFNPPSECVTFPVTCFQNECNGGPNIGLFCSAPDGALTTQCPGFTFLCRRAYNEDAYCGSSSPTTPLCIGDSTNGFFCAESANNGTPCGTTEPDPSVCQPTAGSPHPENSFCLSNPSGICSGGPNFGQPCTAPHGTTTAECPATASPPAPTTVTVDLPMPAGTSFFDADNGGAPSGGSVVWNVPAPAACAPNCVASLNARLLVDALVPEGTVITNQVTTTDVDGFQVSAPHDTTIARMDFRSLSLTRGPIAGKGRFSYRTRFSLNATESLDPYNEAFSLTVTNANGSLVSFALPAGQIVESSLRVFTYRNTDPGLRSLVLKDLGNGLWSMRARGVNLTVPPVTALTITIETTIGGDTFTQPARFFVKNGGKRFVATTAP